MNEASQLIDSGAHKNSVEKFDLAEDFGGGNDVQRKQPKFAIEPMHEEFDVEYPEMDHHPEQNENKGNTGASKFQIDFQNDEDFEIVQPQQRDAP